jgi:pantothenate kinase
VSVERQRSKCSLTDLYRWFIDASREVAKYRLTHRHLAARIESTLHAAEKRVEHNDLPNGDFVRLHSRVSEVIIKNN